MKTTGLLLSLLGMLGALSPASAGDFATGAIGTAGSEFLLFDVGVRGIGMGGAYTAATNDSTSLYWNPAGLTKIPRVSSSFMYSRYVADINYHAGSYAQRINDSSVIAGGYRYLDGGNIMHTDTSDNDLGQFRPRSYVGELGWGQSVYDLSDNDMDLAVGVTARWIHSDYLLHADGYGGDVGIQSRFYTGSTFYDVGFSAQNMGVGQNFDKVRDTLPFRARLGTSIYPAKALIVSLEAIMPANNSPHGAVGVEYTLELQKNIKTALRAGFNSQTFQSLGPFSTMSMGMGLTISDLTLDYAFVPYGVLGTSDVHRISFSFNLPSKISRRYRER